MRSHVGGRKSYGTTPPTRPCHVRSDSGLASSVATAATTRPTTASRTRRRSPRKVPILQTESSPKITLHVLPPWARAVIFGALGVALLMYSYIKLTQSVLGPFLPGNSTGSLVDVIHAFRLKGRGPRIVAIGGGTGLSALLRGLKTYTSNLSAIVTVADDGGSSGRLRDEYRILPPGDFRQCLIALADAEPLMKQLFDHRF